MPLKEADIKAAVATDKPYKLQDGNGLHLLVKQLADGSTGNIGVITIAMQACTKRYPLVHILRPIDSSKESTSGG